MKAARMLGLGLMLVSQFSIAETCIIKMACLPDVQQIISNHGISSITTSYSLRARLRHDGVEKSGVVKTYPVGTGIASSREGADKLSEQSRISAQNKCKADLEHYQFNNDSCK